MQPKTISHNKKVLKPDDTVVSIRELTRNITALISSRNKLTPELTELRDLLTNAHWEIESLLKQRLAEALYVTTRPAYHRDGNKLLTRFKVFQGPFFEVLSKLNFRDLCDISNEWETITSAQYRDLLLFNRHRNNFLHASMGKIHLFSEPERKKNLLELVQRLLVAL